MSNLNSRLLVLVLLVAAVAMLADLLTAPRSKFTAANYERLEIDMTMGDAIAILGEPDVINRVVQDLAMTTWYSPFEVESSITGVFLDPSGKLKSMDRAGRLPDRPLLMPEVLPKHETPSYFVMLQKHEQDEERRATLMLDPPARESNGPVLP